MKLNKEDRNPAYTKIYLEIAECLLKNGQTIENLKDAKTLLELKECNNEIKSLILFQAIKEKT